MLNMQRTGYIESSCCRKIRCWEETSQHEIASFTCDKLPVIACNLVPIGLTQDTNRPPVRTVVFSDYFLLQRIYSWALTMYFSMP